MNSLIELKNMRFFAHHGVMPQETVVGNEFLVNIRLDADLSIACQSDNVNDTINYAQVYELVKTEMMQPSKLIENVAFRVMRSIKDTFPQITAIEVRLAKMHPPIIGEVECAEITVSM